jgi:hypothetical protein
LLPPTIDGDVFKCLSIGDLQAVRPQSDGMTHVTGDVVRSTVALKRPDGSRVT